MDNIYCISLEKKKEEWNGIIDNIQEKTDLEGVKIFPAVSGKDVEKIYMNNSLLEEAPENIQNIFKNNGDFMSVWALYKLNQNQERREHAQLGSWGAVGCYLSHFSLWNMLYEKDLGSMLIFEDDVSFSSDFKEKFKNVINNIPEDADVVFLDLCWCEKSEKFNDIFDKVKGQFFGLHAYIITISGAKKLLKKIFPIEVQLDAYISFLNNIEELNMYRTYGLCGQTIHISSIQTNCITCDISTKRLLYWNVFWLFFFLIIIVYLVFYRK